MSEALKPGCLVLEDGEVFEGLVFGSGDTATGEVVFNTSMTGYQEVLTDPSYHGQIVTMTYPHIGNYGTNPVDLESSRVRVSGFVIRDLPVRWSSWRGEQSLEQYLSDSGISGITEVDTRRLTRHIRDSGAMRGVISTAPVDADSLKQVARGAREMVGADLVVEVTSAKPFKWEALDAPRFSVAAYDFGIKHNILRLLAATGCEVTVYPASTPAEEILASGPDGVFLSNGPGDPEAVGYAIESVRSLLGKVPVFGICLGHQLLALACGLDTYKLRFGHRGINHPVVRLDDGAIEITTQNHGFAVKADAFGFDPPEFPGRPIEGKLQAETEVGGVKLTHLNLNDYTVEGIELLEAPAFSVQYHPEAGPGPHDARYLFERFTNLMEKGVG